MAAQLKRKDIKAASLSKMVNPLAQVDGISGVVVHHVGQGDAIGLLDLKGQCVLRIDYGGKQSSPFLKSRDEDERVHAINEVLQVQEKTALMLTHWDEDHWSSARLGTAVLKHAHWLVPRQWTSPRAVARTAEIDTIHCVPETPPGRVYRFETQNGDTLWWEKLRPFTTDPKSEDCNLSGVALSVVSRDDQVIFLPGDTPFDKVPHYGLHAIEGRRMRGLVAFHHGAATHWTKATHDFLKDWKARATVEPTVVFSYGAPNGYNHPAESNYSPPFPNSALQRTPDADEGVIKIGF